MIFWTSWARSLTETELEKVLSYVKLNIKSKKERTLFLAEWKLFFYWILREFVITLNGFNT